MAEAVPSYTSTKRRITVADFEKLMLHFATLAQDADAIMYYASAEERRYRHILRAVEADFAFFRNEGFDDAYLLAIYHQTGAPDYNTIEDIPAEKLRLIVQIADSYVRKLRIKAGCEIWQLPSAGEPWCIRGIRAADLRAARVAHPAQFAPVRAVSPSPGH